MPNEREKGDNSEDLNLETIYQGSGPLAEFEAMDIKNLLEANGITAVLFGDSVLPNFPFEVRVAHDRSKQARAVIAEAQNTEPEE